MRISECGKIVYLAMEDECNVMRGELILWYSCVGVIVFEWLVEYLVIEIVRLRAGVSESTS